jgi:hypothetical protein
MLDARTSGAASDPTPPSGSGALSSVPRTFAVLALGIGIAGGLAHFLPWLGRESPISGDGLPIVGVPGSESVWIFVDAYNEFLLTILLAGTVLGGLLVVIGFGLWYRSWWARPAVLWWCALVIAAFALDTVMAVHTAASFTATETDFWQRIGPVLSSYIGVTPTIWLQSIVHEVVQGAPSEIGAAFLGMLGTYFLVVGWFPALVAIVFGRSAARAYFATHPAGADPVLTGAPRVIQ